MDDRAAFEVGHAGLAVISIQARALSCGPFLGLLEAFFSVFMLEGKAHLNFSLKKNLIFEFN